jgi:phosphomevalonate decarboxylase
VPAYFSIDTGATVYINTDVVNVDIVEERIKSLGIGTMRCGVGGAARLTDDHLF